MRVDACTLCGESVYINGVKKGDGDKNTHGGGGGGWFKEMVGLPASPQQGGGKGIDSRTYSEV
jgi:hypothetical protein